MHMNMIHVHNAGVHPRYSCIDTFSMHNFSIGNILIRTQIDAHSRCLDCSRTTGAQSYISTKRLNLRLLLIKRNVSEYCHTDTQLPT